MEGGAATPKQVQGGQAGIALAQAEVSVQPQQGQQPQQQQAQPAQLPASMPAPQIDEETRQKLAQVLGDILVKAQELAFEIATIEPGQLGRCPALKPVLDKARDLIMSVKELFSLRRAITG